MNRTKFEEILKVVKDYQRTADRQFSEYQKKVSRMKSELNDETFNRKMKLEVYPYYFGTLTSDRNMAKEEVHSICEDIKGDLKSWMMKPIKPETMQILSCINDFGIRLSREELSILEDDVKSNLFAGKIFSGIAKNNGYAVKLPDFTEYLRILMVVESDAGIAIDAYCGAAPDFPGKDLLDKQRRNGAAFGEWQIWSRMYAANFENTHGSLDDASRMWEQSKVSVEYTLTEAERDRIKKMMDEVEKLDEAGKADKMLSILGNEKDLPDKLRLMGDDYRELASKYASAGSQN